MKHALLSLPLCMLTLIPGAEAQSVIGKSEPYRKCTDLAHSDPAAAAVFSERWMAVDPSPSAIHCRGLVLFESARYAEAAALFDRLSQAVSMADTALRVGILRQAARAWQGAKDLPQAMKRLDQALMLTGPERMDAASQRQRVEILIDRAAVWQGMRQPMEAIQDLDQALTYAILRDQALLARARIEAANGQQELAVQDIQEILKANPRHEEARAALKAIVEKKPH